jgi:hypothetical protein
VLSSSGATGTNSLNHSLLIASLVRASTTGSCDTINVAQWQHSLDTVTHELSLSLTMQFSFQAQESNSLVSVCGN